MINNEYTYADIKWEVIAAMTYNLSIIKVNKHVLIRKIKQYVIKAGQVMQRMNLHVFLTSLIQIRQDTIKIIIIQM